MSKIEWTQQTWNPIAGCSVLSPGCKRCYAMKMARRLELMGSAVYAGLTQQSAAGPVWTGKIAVNESTMLAPLRRKKPTMYFVNSMSDLFHEAVSDETIARIFNVMADCPQHTFQVLTKRSDRMRKIMTGPKSHALWSPKLWHRSVLPNVWLGVSVEDQKRADERIDDLEATPAAVRFLSIEPMLGPIDLSRWLVCPNALDGLSMDPSTGAYECCTNCDWTGVIGSIGWVIVGCESGPGARQLPNEDAQSVVDQCQAASVPVFVKQLSSGSAKAIKDIEQFPEELRVREWPV